MPTCEYCGKELTNKSRKFCNMECYQASHRLSDYQFPTCEYCGKEITEKSHKKGGVRKFCNNECRMAARHPRGYQLTTCKYCGKLFREKRYGLNLYCSKKCSASAQAQAAAVARDEREVLDREERDHRDTILRELQDALAVAEHLRFRLEHEKKCAVCGEWFTAKQTTYICCSPECSKKRDNAQHDHRNSRNGKPDYSITLSRLYRRDGGVCKLCGKELSFDIDPQSGDYPSIDHIVPLAKGGLHQWDNVQLACRRCNWEKGDQMSST